MRLNAEMSERLLKQAQRHITKADLHEIFLDLHDFTVIDNEIYLDGMDPDDWIEAMIMD